MIGIVIEGVVLGVGDRFEVWGSVLFGFDEVGISL